ncbi:MAG: hypothetical protein ACYC4L_15780 [Chloroflexota bacterium]
MEIDFGRFVIGLGNTVLWSAVAVVIVILVFELLDRRYKLMSEIFRENSTAAALFAGSFVLGIFYTVVQIVIH